MITTQLERAILQGWATFDIHNHAWGNFGRIKIPVNSTVIITHVKWFPFLNPMPKMERPTYRELLKYNEYQLKIDGKKSTNYLIYKNSNDFKMTNGGLFDLNKDIDEAFVKENFLYIQKEPIHTDTYFICEEYVKLTITRNAFINKINPQYQPLNKQTDLQKPQKGLEGVDVLNYVELDSISKQMYYFPASLNDASLTAAPSPNTMECNYYQDVDDPYSFFKNLGDDIHFPYSQYPLVQIGYVTINNNNFDKLKNG